MPETMEDLTIPNRVATSSLVTLDLGDYMEPDSAEIIDLKEWLFEELILKEKDFRSRLKDLDEKTYINKLVLVTCSSDAIIPSWAYMLVVGRLHGHAKEVVIGNDSDLEKAIIDQAIARVDVDSIRDGKVVIKGCGSISNRDYAYAEITKKLLPHVNSLMYGEPCSTVPVYKRPRKSG